MRKNILLCGAILACLSQPVVWAAGAGTGGEAAGTGGIRVSTVKAQAVEAGAVVQAGTVQPGAEVSRGEAAVKTAGAGNALEQARQENPAQTAEKQEAKGGEKAAEKAAALENKPEGQEKQAAEQAAAKEEPGKAGQAKPEKQEGQGVKSVRLAKARQVEVPVVEGALRKPGIKLVKPYKAVRVQGPINLVWDVFGPKDNLTQLVKETRNPHINVVSPCWWAITSAQGDIALKATDLDYVERAHDRGYAVWALITNGFDAKLTHELLDNPAGRTQVVRQLCKLAHDYQLDGVNLDFENIKMEDRDRLTDFVGEIAQALHKQGLTVSIDVTVPSENGNWSKCYDRKGLAEQVDYVMLMAYDQHSRLSPVSGSVAGLDWVEQGVKLVLQEVPAKKLVLGMPLYMRLWKEENGKVTASTLTMKQAEQLIADKELVPGWKSQEGQHYFEYKDQNVLYRVWQEDARSLALKSALVSRYDLAGRAYWRKGFEDPEIWGKVDPVF